MDISNPGRHVASIIDRQDCKHHNVPVGIPCYHIRSTLSEKDFAGVCNRRAVLAGANGKVSNASLTSLRKQFKKRS